MNADNMQEDAEIKYKNILKIELKGMLLKFLDNRSAYHIYSIDRCCTHSSLLGFSYNYRVINNDYIEKRIDLGVYGEVLFYIDVKNSSATVDDNSIDVIRGFLDNYPED